MGIISQLKFKGKNNLFVRGRCFCLKGIIDDIDVYYSIEEKGANFIYVIVFIDDNKRIAVTLFIYFLLFYNLVYKDSIKGIDNNTLTSFTLLNVRFNPK